MRADRSFRAALRGLGGKAPPVLEGAGRLVRKGLAVILTTLAATISFLALAWAATRSALARAWAATREMLARSWAATRSFLALAWAATRSALARAWAATRSALARAWAATISALARAWAATISALARAWAATISFLARSWAATRAMLARSWAATISALARAWAATRSALARAWTATISFLARALAAARAETEKAAAATRKAFEKALAATLSTIEAVVRVSAPILKKSRDLAARGLRVAAGEARRGTAYAILFVKENRTAVVLVLLIVLVFGGFIAYVLGLGLKGVAQPDNGYRPATEWRFAAGSTANGLRTMLHVLNPGGDGARVKVTYMYGASEAVEKEHEAPSRSGFLVDCMQDLGGLQLDFGMRITSNRPIIVSREISNTAAGWAASTVEQGIRAPSAEWAFAEGSTSDGRRTSLYLLNEQDVAATVTIEGFRNDGERKAMAVGIQPHSSFFLDAARMFDNADNVSLAVSADGPVYAERYYETVYRGLRVACCCPGSRGLVRSDTVVVPGDAQMGRVGILNPAPVKSTVRLTYYLEGGRVVRTDPVEVDGYCRKVVGFDDRRLGPGDGVVGRSGFRLNVRVIDGGPVAVETTDFGSGNDAWTWLAVSTGARPADGGPVYVPVVNNPGYRECLAVANDRTTAIGAELVPRRADGEGEKTRRVKLGGGATGYVYASKAGSGMSWYEVGLPAGSRWKLFSYRAFSCRTVDKTAIAFGFGRRIQGVQTGDQALALTFNMEGEPEAAKAVLDQLKADRVTATFFVSGDFARAYPDLVRQAAREGHELANLTRTHASKSGQQLVQELEETESIVAGLTGLSTRPYARLPVGTMGYAGITAANRAGYVEVTWNDDSRDWDSRLPPETVVANAMQDARPGSVVLMTTINAAQKRQVLPALIKGMKDQGLKIVPLTELLYFAQ